MSNFQQIFQSPLGPIFLVWKYQNNSPKISRIYLNKKNDYLLKTCPQIDALIKDLKLYLAGEKVDFNLDILDLDICSDFQKKVLLTVAQIPSGHIKTYKQIALSLGIPRGARAVGNALANNPFPLIIPCHRVIKSDGSLGQYQYGVQMKKNLIKFGNRKG